MKQKKDIVDKFFKLNKDIPDEITYNSLMSVSYYENYTAQNQNIIGKNILNIGERHFSVDENFEHFIHFLQNLIKKNFFLEGCLDFVFENSIEKIELDSFEQSMNQQIEEYKNEEQISTINSLRKFFGRIKYKGFRTHFTDNRLGFNGFKASLIHLLIFIETIYYKKNNHKQFEIKYDNFIDYDSLFHIFFVFIYDYHLLLNYYDYKTVMKNIWNLFLVLNDFPKLYQQQKNIYVKKLTNRLIQSKSNLTIDKIQQLKFNKNQLKKLDHQVLHFVISVQNFLEPYEKNKKGFLEQDVTLEQYYQYVDNKTNKHSVEETILSGKKTDNKFKKQIDNIDHKYFKEDPRIIILCYFLEFQPKGSFLFYDVQTLSRVFRTFDENKNRFPSCDQNEKSMKNVIIYSGESHAKNINRFLKFLPKFKLQIVNDRIRLANNPNSSEVKPNLYLEKKIASTYDFFKYNEMIIQFLKKKYNLRQYTQLNSLDFSKL